MAKMLPRILVVISAIVAKSQSPGKTFIDYNGVLELPGKPRNVPIQYNTDAPHCKRDCFTDSACYCAVFSAAAASCEFRTECENRTVHYGVGGQFTVFVRIPDALPQYKEFQSRNTYTGSGSTNLASDAREMVVSHEVCLARCSVNDVCDCVVYKTKSEAAYRDGGCWLRKDCHPTDFRQDNGFSVYVKQRGTVVQAKEGPSAELQGQLKQWKAKAQEAEEEAAEAQTKYKDATSKLTKAAGLNAADYNAHAQAQAKTLQNVKAQLEEAKKEAAQTSQKFLSAKESFTKKQAAAEAARLAAEAKAKKEKETFAMKQAAAEAAMLAAEVSGKNSKESFAKKQAAAEAARLAAEAKAKDAKETFAMKQAAAEAARLAAEAKAKKAEKAAKDAALANDQPHATYWWAHFWMTLLIVLCCLWCILALILGWCCRKEARQICSAEEVPAEDKGMEETLVSRVTELETLLAERNTVLADQEKGTRLALEAAEKEKQQLLAAEEEKWRAHSAAAAAAATAAAAKPAAKNKAKKAEVKEHKVAYFALEKGEWKQEDTDPKKQIWVKEGETKTIMITHKPLGFHISADKHTVTRVFKFGDEEYSQEAIEQGIEVGMRLAAIGDPDSPGKMEDITEDHDKAHVNHRLNVMLAHLAPEKSLAPKA